MKLAAMILLIIGAVLVITAIIIFILTNCKEAVKNLKTIPRMVIEKEEKNNLFDMYYNSGIGENTRINLENNDFEEESESFKKTVATIAVDDTALLISVDNKEGDDLNSTECLREQTEILLNDCDDTEMLISQM